MYNYAFLQPAGINNPGPDTEYFNGTEMKLGLEYVHSWWQVGAKVSQYSYSNVELGHTDITSYTTDVQRITYTYPFFQEHVSMKYIVPGIYVGVNTKLFNALKLKLNYGTTADFGHENRVRMSSDGNNTPAKIGAKFHDRSEVSLTWLNYVAVSAQTKLYKSLNVGLNYSYHDILDYHAYGLQLSVDF